MPDTDDTDASDTDDTDTDAPDPDPHPCHEGEILLDDAESMARSARIDAQFDLTAQYFGQVIEPGSKGVVVDGAWGARSSPEIYDGYGWGWQGVYVIPHDAWVSPTMDWEDMPEITRYGDPQMYMRMGPSGRTTDVDYPGEAITVVSAGGDDARSSLYLFNAAPAEQTDLDMADAIVECPECEFETGRWPETARLFDLGDVDGDGLDDLIADYSYEGRAGFKVFLAPFAPMATSADSDLSVDGTPEMPPEGGLHRGDQLLLSDADGDGHLDMFVGGGTDYRNESTSGPAGAVYGLKGPLLDRTDWSDGDVVILAPGHSLGSPSSHPGLRDVGDVTGDGFPDLAATADEWTGSAPNSVVIIERSEGVWYADDLPTLVPEGAGNDAVAAAGLGDMDGDGQADLIAWEYDFDTFAFGMYIVPGPIGPGSTSMSEAPVIGRFTLGDGWAGITPIGDYDADGRPDFVLAEQLGSEPSKIHLFYGCDSW